MSRVKTKKIDTNYAFYNIFKLQQFVWFMGIIYDNGRIKLIEYMK